MSYFLALAFAAYLTSGIFGLGDSMRRGARLFRTLALATLGVGVVANTLWIIARWEMLGYPPFSEMHGCLVLLGLCVGLVALSLELLVGLRFVGGLSSLGAAGVLLFAGRHLAETRPLPPPLQSLYFAPHVLAYFIAYGALSVAGLASLAFLVVRPFSGGENADVSVSRFLKETQEWVLRAVRIGFPFLTLGLVLGAFWAQQAYADYWSWDPKEVWALITWVLVAAWFHLHVAGRRGVVAAAVMLVAVGALYFTLLGVPLLPTAVQSVHSYTGP